MDGFPVLMHTALDATDCRALAEFYRAFLGLRYRPGDEVPASGDDGADWLVLVDEDGRRVRAPLLPARGAPLDRTLRPLRRAGPVAGVALLRNEEDDIS